MTMKRKHLLAVGLMAGLISTLTQAGTEQPANAHVHQVGQAKEAPAPRIPQSLPPSAEQIKFDLAPTTKPRLDLMPSTNSASQLRSTNHSRLQLKSAQLVAAPANDPCRDMNVMASYSGAALADYVANLPDFECHYPLFSLSAAQDSVIFSPANYAAVAERFVTEAARYDASNIKLLNLVIYLRAGYFLSDASTQKVPASILTTLRPAIHQLLDGDTLFKVNTDGANTANEVLRLVTNMSDEAYHLPSIKNLIIRYTPTPANPNAAQPLFEYGAANGFTGVLTAMFYANFKPASRAILATDASYPQALFAFVQNATPVLLGTERAYQLTDAENETFRFMQFPALFSTIKPMVKTILANNTMTGPGADLWINAAMATTYYDNANCADYGTCNFVSQLSDIVLSKHYTCSPTIKIRAQQMTQDQMQASCDLLAKEETYFHGMMQTNYTPVANDFNTSLEVVVFSDYTNYSKYAGVLFGISTNNGGMSLEGNPADPNNQARFIAHEASWLRPTFSVWNLEHEYVHYLDSRFDMYGDFGTAISQPTVWYIEGLAEYLSLKNNDQTAIDMVKAGGYQLSEIFGNNYAMTDYQNRAYRWGYMATRYMFEEHRGDINAVLAKFRSGDYAGYEAYMQQIGTGYDADFAAWAQKASTAGTPPAPTWVSTLPACASTSQLAKDCAIRHLSSTYRSYATIMVPANAKNLRIMTSGGSGDANLYVALDHWPLPTAYDFASTYPGNEEYVTLTSPQANRWYYVVLDAKTPFSEVTLYATWE